jgi:hypothetical protein
MKYLLLFLALFSYSYAQFETPPIYQPFNLSFENSAVGAVPAMWNLSSEDQENGYYAEATNENPQDGKYCLMLEYKSDTLAGENTRGTVVQSFDATPYIGKKVRFTAYVRAEIEGEGYAGFYVSERTVQNQYPFVHTNEDDPIVFNTWKKYTVDYTVTDNAYSLTVGIFLKGMGKAWIDNINIEVIDQVKDIELPSPISKELTESLLSFAKGYGYTKFYSPSDEVKNMDNETFLYHSIKALETAKGTNKVAQVIEDRLKRIAPAIRIFKSEATAKKYHLNKPKEAQDRVAIAKITKNIYFKSGNYNVGTQRHNIYDSRMPREGATYQIIGAKNLQGKKLKYKALAKVKPYGYDAHAELWLRVDLEDETKPPLNLKIADIITSDEWKEYSMDVEIPKDAKQIRTGLVFFGEGKVWFDNVELTEDKPNISLEYKPKNNSFDGKWLPNEIEYWRIPYSVLKSGYEFTVDSSKESYDGNSLLIATNKGDYLPLSAPAEVCDLKIGSNLWLALPLTLYDDGTSTLPKSTAPQEAKISMNPEGRVAKIAAFIEMWNYLKTYSTVDLSSKEWDDLFREYVSKVAQTKSTAEFTSQLNQVLKVTNNVRSEAWLTEKPKDFVLPFIVDFSGDDAIIIKSFDKQIEAGDKLISIGGTNLNEYMAKEIATRPGASLSWKKKKAYYQLAEGDFKSVEKVVVERGGEEKQYDFARNLTGREVHIERPLTIEWLDSNIVYIDGTRFGDFEMKRLMASFKGAKGIVVDLRGESLLSEHFLGFFLDKDISTFDWTLSAYTSPCKEKTTTELNGVVKARESILPNNIVFLSNETSVGTSEIILRLAKQYGIGKIVGEASTGSYGSMEQVKLPALYNFSFDIYPISFNGDKNIKYKPVSPDITITSKKDYPNDEKIKKAVEILRKNF